MRVLISLLGLAPGVVTGAYYALVRDRGIPIDRVVTLTTNHQQASDCEREIERELQRWQDEQRVTVRYDGLAVLYEPESGGDSHQSLQKQMADACRLRIPEDDLNTEHSVNVFREAMLTLVRDVYRDDEVYLCVAGGRKSMSAIAAIAAQLYGHGVKGLYHLFVSRGIERDGMIDVLPTLPTERKRCVLRPTLDEVQLVELPFFQLTMHEGQLRLTLRGQIQEHILEYLADNPELVTVLEPDTHGQVLGYVFEDQVAHALCEQEYFARPRHRIAKGDVDVWAIKKGTDLAKLEPTQADMAQLRQNLIHYFNDSELRDLCFDLGVDYESLPGTGKSDKARELVSYLDRRGRVPELTWMGQQLRPNTPWPGISEKAQGEMLVIECKLYENTTQLLTVDKVDQAIKYRDAMQNKWPRSQVQAWVVTNAEAAEDDTWRHANEHDVKLMTTGELSSDFMHKLDTGKWIALIRKNWITGVIQLMKQPDAP